MKPPSARGATSESEPVERASHVSGGKFGIAPPAHAGGSQTQITLIDADKKNLRQSAQSAFYSSFSSADQFVVEIKGADVCDPTTGAIRNSSTGPWRSGSRVALEAHRLNSLTFEPLKSFPPQLCAILNGCF
jgi:hypothetical protein